MSVGSIDKCYAAAIGGCGGGLSREHPISKCLLERLCTLGDGTGADIEAPWFKGGVRSPMFESALKNRVLCRDHNKALSPYDKEVCKLFDIIAASMRKELKSWETINGGYIERWALKSMFADVAAGKFKYSFPGDQRDQRWRKHRDSPPTDITLENPPEEWLRVLFQGAPMPPRCGFYYSATPRKQVDATFGSFYNLTPINDRFPETLHGVTFVVLNFWFTVSIAPLDEQGAGLMYRPSEFSSWDPSAGFRFNWESP